MDHQVPVPVVDRKEAVGSVLVALDREGQDPVEVAAVDRDQEVAEVGQVLAGLRQADQAVVLHCQVRGVALVPKVPVFQAAVMVHRVDRAEDRLRLWPPMKLLPRWAPIPAVPFDNRPRSAA